MKVSPCTILLLVGIFMLEQLAGAMSDFPINQWDQRLQQLDPARPMMYFELAEDIAEQAQTQDQRDLAMRVFGLAGLLGDRQLARSAALAIASMTDRASEPTRYRRLTAAAALLDDRPGRSITMLVQPVKLEDAHRILDGLAAYRSGRATSSVMRRITQIDPVQLSPVQHLFPGGSIDRFIESSQVYRRGVRPSMSTQELASELRLEEALLAGKSRSFSTDLLLTRNRPLVEVDPDSLAELFRVDPARSTWRDGTWQAPAEIGNP
ncbi:MAG: hypothetical protein CMJ32_00715 [Phycisphaerae bacterium]|nr:hypothetical protein [Phycisphaerae bacterium]